MKSIRDLANRLPETRSGLEEAVIGYSPAIREALERNPGYRDDVREAVNGAFDRYSHYLGGFTHTLSAAGHAVGYTADAWLATGDIVGSLGGKFINLLAQIPEKAYSLVYAARTGDYLGSLQNVFEGLVSYLPGLTIADQGLSRIVQKKMLHSAVYDAESRLGIEHKTWFARTAESIKDKYTDVESRVGNIISPRQPVPASA